MCIRCDSIVQIVKILSDLFPCPAIISIQKVIDHFICVAFRVPQQLGNQISPQFCKLSAPALISSLFHDANGIVVPECLDVGLKNLEIGIRHNVVTKVDHIIPDVHVGRDGRPAFEIFEEGFVLRTGFEIMREATFDAAKSDDHIVSGRDIFGR